MNKAKQLANKNVLWAKIKRFGELWIEDVEFIKEYGKLIYEANLDDLEGAIECFTKLVEQSERIGSKNICKKET